MTQEEYEKDRLRREKIYLAGEIDDMDEDYDQEK
jgi:hypothetical protein